MENPNFCLKVSLDLVFWLGDVLEQASHELWQTLDYQYCLELVLGLQVAEA